MHTEAVRRSQDLQGLHHTRWHYNHKSTAQAVNEPMQNAALVAELKLIQARIDAWLLHCREMLFRDMREVSPGVWLHNRYPDVASCLRAFPLN